MGNDNFGTLRTVLSRQAVLFSEGPLSRFCCNINVESELTYKEILIFISHFLLPVRIHNNLCDCQSKFHLIRLDELHGITMTSAHH